MAGLTGTVSLGFENVLGVEIGKDPTKLLLAP